MSKPLSRSIRKADIILYTSLLFWVIMFLWSYFATLEEVTRGQGRVIASSKIQVIQNLEGGIVKEILVQTGDQVTRSQPLIKLDETQFKSELASMQQRLERLQAQSNAAIENFELIQQEQDIVAPLVEKGVESQMELIRLKQRLNEA